MVSTAVPTRSGLRMQTWHVLVFAYAKTVPATRGEAVSSLFPRFAGSLGEFGVPSSACVYHWRTRKVSCDNAHLASKRVPRTTCRSSFLKPKSQPKKKILTPYVGATWQRIALRHRVEYTYHVSSYVQGHHGRGGSRGSGGVTEAQGGLRSKPPAACFASSVPQWRKRSVGTSGLGLRMQTDGHVPLRMQGP